MTENKIPEDQLIAEICRLEQELGKVPSMGDMNRRGKYSTAPYTRAFESWTEAVKTAGYDPRPDRTEYSKTELLTELEQVAQQCDGVPTERDLLEYDGPSSQTYKNQFGSWTTALEVAGYDPPTSGRRLSQQELCSALQALAEQVDRPPTTTDMNDLGPYSPGTYVNRFGSWEAALEAADIESL